MPAVQRRAALRLVNTANKKDDHDHQQPNNGFFTTETILKPDLFSRRVKRIIAIFLSELSL